MSLVEDIKKHEGWSPRVYKDTVGKLTIGYGFNIEDTDLPKPVAELWLSILIYEHETMLKKYHWYNRLNPVRQDVLLNMHYNLGHTRFMGFKKMIRALENEKFGEASMEMLDSKWAGQVGKRADELANKMRKG